MKKIYIVIALICFATQLFAQRNINERIKVQKIAFITERLDLSASEAAKFWPVYNEFEKTTESLRKGDLQEIRKAIRGGNLSDNEAQDLLNRFMAAEEKMHQAKKDLVRKLKNVIPPQKIIALKTAEDAFNKKLLEQLRKRREQFQKRNNNNRN